MTPVLFLQSTAVIIQPKHTCFPTADWRVGALFLSIVLISLNIYFLQKKLFQVKAHSQLMMTPTSMLNKFMKVIRKFLSLYEHYFLNVNTGNTTLTREKVFALREHILKIFKGWCTPCTWLLSHDFLLQSTPVIIQLKHTCFPTAEHDPRLYQLVTLRYLLISLNIYFLQKLFQVKA